MFRLILVILATALNLGTQSLAYAGGVNVQTFNQATGTAYETTEGALLDRGAFGPLLSPKEFHIATHYHFADHPLVEYDSNLQDRTGVLVNGLHTLQVTGAIITSDWAAAIVAPIHGVGLAGQNYQMSLGDFKAQGKYVVARSEDHRRALALVPEIYFPTGNTDDFVSNDSIGIGLRLALEQDFGPIRGAINAGFLHFGKGTYREIDYRNQVPYSLALSYPVTPNVAINGEFFQSITLPRNSLENPGELYLGSKIRLKDGMTGGAGVSLGQFDFLKANDIRVHMGVDFRL